MIETVFFAIFYSSVFDQFKDNNKEKKKIDEKSNDIYKAIDYS